MLKFSYVVNQLTKIANFMYLSTFSTKKVTFFLKTPLFYLTYKRISRDMYLSPIA